MTFKPVAAAILLLLTAACGEPYREKKTHEDTGILPYRQLSGRWRCVYKKIEETGASASYSMKENYYRDQQGGLLTLYPDYTFLHNIGLPKDQYAKGSVSLYDSLDQEMTWYTIYSYADSTDSVNRFIESFDVSFNKDTLILSSDKKHDDREIIKEYKLLAD